MDWFKNLFKNDGIINISNKFYIQYDHRKNNQDWYKTSFRSDMSNYSYRTGEDVYWVCNNEKLEIPKQIYKYMPTARLQ